MTDKPGGLADALARVQAQLPSIGKDKTAQVRSEKGNYSYTYADLASVQHAVFPLLSEQGLAWITRPTFDDAGRYVLAYTLAHGPSGEREDGSYPLPDPTRGTPQQIGSAITYGRRYCLSAVVGVATEDDDGKAASEGSAPKAQTRRQKPEGAAADAAHHDRELRKGGPKAERGVIPPDEDPWASTPVRQPPVTTDEAWLTAWDERLAEANSKDTLATLWKELVAQHKAEKVTDEDRAGAEQRWQTVKAEVDANTGTPLPLDGAA